MTVFLHLSDIHILAGEGEVPGARPAGCLRRVLARIDALPVVPDFCVIGDGVSKGKEDG